MTRGEVMAYPLHNALPDIHRQEETYERSSC